jgi:hypothetical protein
MTPDPFTPLDGTVAEIQRLRDESRSTVLRKIKRGVYQSYLSGGRRKIVLASVMEDRAREMEASEPKRQPPIRQPSA